MSESDWLAESFEAHRGHLRGVAYRMLGSLAEAEDAVQEAWLRLARAGADGVENLGGWLTTAVARVCLDMLRTRQSRREESLEADAGAPDPPATSADPEQETLLADSVGLAMLVVLETLPPPERVAFVLHDMFAMPYEEIAPIVGRSEQAARQLASRARRRVQGADAPLDPDQTRQRQVVEAFLAASRAGDFGALLALLDPDVVARSDRGIPPDMSRSIRGAAAVAERAVRIGARAARPALIDGVVGAVVAPRGHLMMVLRYTVRDGRIVEIEGIWDPERLQAVDLKVLG
jgi:RNA polymerase sigma factor (sigma-70 family)